jgi:hypothetical protein
MGVCAGAGLTWAATIRQFPVVNWQTTGAAHVCVVGVCMYVWRAVCVFEVRLGLARMCEVGIA